MKTLLEKVLLACWVNIYLTVSACVYIELDNVPLEDLQKIRSRIGTKIFDSALKSSQVDRNVRSLKRANKNRYD